MTRLTKEQLEERVRILKSVIGMPMTVGYWNGFAHVYNKENGAMLTSGTLRECYNYIDAFMHGFTCAERGEL